MPDEILPAVLYTFATSYSAPFVALYLVMVLLSSRLMKLFPAVELRTLLTAHSRLCCLINLYALCFLAAGFWQVREFVLWWSIPPHLGPAG